MRWTELAFLPHLLLLRQAHDGFHVLCTCFLHENVLSPLANPKPPCSVALGAFPSLLTGEHVALLSVPVALKYTGY